MISRLAKGLKAGCAYSHISECCPVNIEAKASAAPLLYLSVRQLCGLNRMGVSVRKRGGPRDENSPESLPRRKPSRLGRIFLSKRAKMVTHNSLHSAVSVSYGVSSQASSRVTLIPCRQYPFARAMTGGDSPPRFKLC